MATTTGTYLHVVYAGRGDAFILEYSVGKVKKVVLLDGGPMGKKHGSDSHAPYWKYYVAACYEVWERVVVVNKLPAVSKFEPIAIINSHADEDHYGGLKYLLERSYKNYIALSGSYLVPAQRKTGSVQWDDMVDLLVTKCKLKESRGFAIPGLKCLFPTNDEVAAFSAVAGLAPKNPPDEVPDLNPGSLLFETSGADTASTMFFTGDSNGKAIQDALKVPAAPPVGYVKPHISIFKIQHHGSLKDSQVNQPSTKLTEASIMEFAIRAVMSIDKNALDPNDDTFPEGTSEAGLKYLIAQMKLRLMKNNQADFDDAYKTLQDRYKDYLRIIINNPQATSIRPGHVNPAWPMAKFGGKSPTQVFEDMVAYVETPQLPFNDPASKNFYEWRKRTRNGPQISTPEMWWLRFKKMTTWGGLHVQYAHCPFVESFFDSFTADAYVVSANYTYAHPSAATLVGLAMACKKQGRKPVLYLTTGDSLDSKMCKYLEKAFQLEIKDHVELRLLSNGTRMTINGANGLAAGTDRDVDKRTKLLDLNIMNVTDMKKKLEKDPTVVPARARYPSDPGVQNWILRPEKGPTRFLTLPAAAGPGALPTVAAGANATTMKIIEGWMLGSDTATALFLQQGVFMVQAEWTKRRYPKGRRAKRDRLFVLQLEASQLDTNLAAGLMYTFYYNAPGNVISFEPIGLQKEEVYFSFNPDPPILYAAMIAGAGTTASLRTYCTAQGISTPQGFSVADAIVAVSSKTGLEALDFGSAFQKPVLASSVDLDQSTVTYDASNVDADVTAATLVSSLPSNSSVEIGSGGVREAFAEHTATIELTYDEKDTLTARMTLNLDRSTALITSKVATNIPRRATLTRYMQMQGVTTAQMGTLKLPKLLGFLMVDQLQVDKMFYGGIPTTLLNAGLAELSPDFEASTVKLGEFALGGEVLERVEIVCRPSDMQSWAKAFSIAGVNIAALESLTLVLQNATLRRASLALTAVASADIGNGKSIKLTVGTNLYPPGPSIITFSVANTASLADLGSILPGNPPLGSAVVPLTKSNTTVAGSNATSLGFSITQDVELATDYTLDSVFATTSLSDWSSFLPAGFPKSAVAASAGVRILSPLSDQYRSVAAKVDLSIGVTKAGSQKVPIHMSFSAEPLAPGNYDYRLAVNMPDSRLSLADITQTLGLGTYTDFINTSAPLIGNVLSSVSILGVTTAVERADDGSWNFTDWTVELAMDELTLITDILTISNANIKLGVEIDVCECAVSGHFRVGKGDNAASIGVSAQLPVDGKPGFLDFNVGMTLSGLALMTALGVPNQSEVPMLGSILPSNDDDVGLSITKAQFNLIKAVSGSFAVVGTSFEFRLDKFSLGQLHLSRLSLQFVYFSKDDPTGPGTAQTIVTLQATWDDGSLQAMLAYDTKDDNTVIRASLASNDNPVTISDVLAKVLPSGTPNALETLIGDLHLEYCKLAVDIGKDSKILSFDLSLVDSATVPLQSTTIRSLKLHYAAATGDKPMTLEMTGLVEKDDQGKIQALLSVSCVADSNDSTSLSFSITHGPNGDLTLLGLLSLFGLQKPTFASPNGCKTNFFDLHVGASGKLMKKADASGKTALSLSKMSVTAQSLESWTIMTDPVLALQNLSLAVDYDAATGISGFVQAQLRVSTVDVAVKFVKDAKGNEVFDGELKLSGQSAVNITSLAPAINMSSDRWKVPSDLTIVEKPGAQPTSGMNLKFGVLGVHVEVGKLVEIHGVGAAEWHSSCAGAATNTTALGALFRITMPKPPKTTKEYEAYITGALGISSFASPVDIRARLDIVPSQPTLLKASMVQRSSGGDSLQSLTNEIDSKSAWSTICPSDAFKPDFANSGLWLSADFSSKQPAGLTLVGNLPKIGCCVLIARNVPDVQANTFKRGYFFSLAVSDLQLVLPNSGNAIQQAFQLKTLCVQFSSYDTTIKEVSSAVAAVETVPGINDNGLSSSISPAGGLDPTSKIERGATLFAIISLGSAQTRQDMSNALALPASTAATPTITLHAHIAPADDSTKTVYKLQLDNFKLFGDSITIAGTATYTPKPEKVIDAAAKLTLHGVANGDLFFDVHMLFKDKSTTWSLAVTDENKNKTIDNPHGMFNVKFAKLTFNGSVTKDTAGKITREYKLGGAVSLGQPGAQHGDLEGLLIFDQSCKPRMALVQWIQTEQFSITRLFQEVIQPGQPTGSSEWPSNFNDFVLTSVKMWYVTGDTDYTDISKVVWTKGYNLQAAFTLWKVPFSTQLSIAEDGIVLSATCNQEVDLKFGKLVGYTPSDANDPIPKSAGAQIGVNTRKQSIYWLASGFKFLGLDPVNVSLTLQPGKDILTGTVSLDGTHFGMNGTVPIGLEYNLKTHQVSVVNFPIFREILQAIQSLSDAIEAGSKIDGSGCEELANLALDTFVTTEFEFHLNMKRNPENEAPSSKLVAALTSNFKVNVIGNPKNPVCDIPLDALTDVVFDLPKSLTWDDIWDCLVQTVKDNAAEIGKALIKDRNGFAELLTLLGLTKFGPGIIAKLLCRGITGENDEILEEGENRSDNETNNIDSKADAASSPTGAAAGVAGAAGLEGATDAFLALAGVCATLLGLVAGLDDSKGVWMKTYNHLSDDKKKAADKKKEQSKDKLAELQKLRDAKKKEIEGWLVLRAAPTCTFAAETSTGQSEVVVDWSKALPTPPAGKADGYFGDWSTILWEVKYSTDGTMPAGDELSNPLPGATHTFTISDRPDFTFAKSISVWVRARCVRKKGDQEETFIATSWTHGKAEHAPWYYAPSSLTLQGGKFIVDALVQNCTSSGGALHDMSENAQLEVAVVGIDSARKETPLKTVTSIIDITAAGSQRVRTIDMASIPTETTSITASARYVPKNAANNHPSAITRSKKPLQVLPPPSGFAAAMDGKKVKVSCAQSDPKAQDYQMVVYSQGQEIYNTVLPGIAGSTFATSIDLPNLWDGEQTRVTMSAKPTGDSSIGLSASQNLTIAFPAALWILDTTSLDPERGGLQMFFNLAEDAPADAIIVAKLNYKVGEPRYPVAPTSFSVVGKSGSCFIKSSPLLVPYPRSIQLAVGQHDGSRSVWSAEWGTPADIAPIDPRLVSLFYDQGLHFSLPSAPGWSQIRLTITEAGTNDSPIFDTILPNPGSGPIVFPPCTRALTVNKSYMVKVLTTSPGVTGTLSMVFVVPDPSKLQPRANFFQAPADGRLVGHWDERNETTTILSNFGESVGYLWSGPDKDPSKFESGFPNLTITDGHAGIVGLFQNGLGLHTLHITGPGQISVCSIDWLEHANLGQHVAQSMRTISDTSSFKVTTVQGGTVDGYTFPGSAATGIAQIFFAEDSDNDTSRVGTATLTGLTYDTFALANHEVIMTDHRIARPNSDKLSMLSASQPVLGIEEVYWITPEGFVVGAVRRKPGTWHVFSLISQSDDPHLASTAGSVKAVDIFSVGTVVFWVTAAGGIACAWRHLPPLGSDGDLMSPFYTATWVRQSVSPSGTAELDTVIAAAECGGKALWLFWYGTEGSVGAAHLALPAVSSSTWGPAVGEAGSWNSWLVAGKGSTRVEGRRALYAGVYGAFGSRRVEVHYITPQMDTSTSVSYPID